MFVILTWKVVLINTSTERKEQASTMVLCMVADHLPLGNHDNVNLEPTDSLFSALVDPLFIPSHNKVVEGI